jgi:Asp-tRNA(Asn)/Glu-tRNA(Gln) amidotransferase A subunit family amidase
MYQRPLEGVRIAVKDLFHLRGLTSSLCNRAYYRVNEPSLSTADCINTLVAQGAQVLGVTKLSSMISREEPTEAVDYPAPFNPRGDGYQSPAGSSSGSAVAVASYDWLDLAIGTDTSGSGRRPALVNGVFQLRPSHAMVNLEGMVPTYLPFDTPCVFGRDLARLKVFAQSWYAPVPKRPNGRVPCIIVPSDFVVENREQREIIDAFVGDLEQSLSVKAARVSISELWRRTAPSEATDQDLNAYLKDVIIQTYYRGFYKSSSDFRQRYLRMFGKQPYVNNFVRWRWNLGREVDDAQHKEGMRRIAAYRTWLLEEIFRPEEQMPIFVLPIANVQPTYRDVPPDPPLPQSGFDPLYISPILGAPDIMLPIGEVRYHSRITESEEYLPVGVNLVGAPGDDTALMATAFDCLVQANRPTKVETGTRIFLPAPLEVCL